jgi:hypothetical protein
MMKKVKKKIIKTLRQIIKERPYFERETIKIFYKSFKIELATNEDFMYLYPKAIYKNGRLITLNFFGGMFGEIFYTDIGEFLKGKLFPYLDNLDNTKSREDLAKDLVDLVLEFNEEKEEKASRKNKRKREIAEEKHFEWESLFV